MSETKQRILVVTTSEERSQDLLSLDGFDTTIELYSEEFARKVKQYTGFDLVYLRDPFTATYHLDQVVTIIASLKEANPDAYFIDSINSIEDILIEDKWLQYELFEDIMPKTELVEDFEDIDFDTQFVKKRISARAKGVIFGLSEVTISDSPQDFIVQEKLEIEDEIRVVTVRDEILGKGVKKASKTTANKVKIMNEVDIPDEMIAITRLILKRLPDLDFTGIDIARTTNGELVLIEVNRSPQFLSFTKRTGINPFSELIHRLRS